jgi:hypothetical protein
VSNIHPILARLLACAMLAFAIAAPAATAAPIDQERYLSSYGAPPALADGTAAAEAQEDYYQSYAPPESRAADGVPWLAIVLPATAVALVAAGAVGATRVRRRNRAARPRERVAV